MSTDPRTEVELVAEAAYESDNEQTHGGWYMPWAKAGDDKRIRQQYEAHARAILAALDLPARDARVRAETLRWVAAVMPAYDRSPVAVRARLNELAQELERSASPSSSPVDAPSRPTGTPEPAELCTTCWVCRGTEPNGESE